MCIKHCRPTQHFCEFCEKNPQANFSGGVQTNDLDALLEQMSETFESYDLAAGTDMIF